MPDFAKTQNNRAKPLLYCVMGEQQNIQIANRVWNEVWHRGDFSVVDELFDDKFIRHDLDSTQGQGKTQNVEFIQRMISTFPDLHYTVEDVIAKDDKVVMRYRFDGTNLGNALGFGPTGKKVNYTGIIIQRFENGKIVEQWTETNLLGLFRQLGIVKT